MNGPQLEVTRKKLIEARQNTWFRNGERVFGRDSSVTYRLLQFPSAPFHYTGIPILDSGTWRTQKIIEILTREDVHWWSGVVTFKAVSYINPTTLESLHEFLKAAFSAQPLLFLDIDLDVSSGEWPDWFLTYRSSSTIEQHVAQGVVKRRENPVCYITVEGSAIYH